MTDPNRPTTPPAAPEPAAGADPQAIKDAVGAGEKRPTEPGERKPAEGAGKQPAGGAPTPAGGRTGATLSTLSDATTSGDGTTPEEGGDALARDPGKSSIGNIR